MFKRNRLVTPHSLGRQIMTLLGIAQALMLAASIMSALIFVYRAEVNAWQGRQSEAARGAAGNVAAVVQRARDTLGTISIISATIITTHQEELQHLLEQNPALDEVARIDANGQVLVDAHRGRVVLGNLVSIPQAQWFQDARRGQTYLGPVQRAFNDDPYLLMAIPAPDGGVVAARVGLGVLWTTVADIKFGYLGRAYVVNHNGDLIAHTRPEVVLAGTNIAGRPELAAVARAADGEWQGEYVNFEGTRVVGASAPVPGTNWCVITELPVAEAFAASQAAGVLLSMIMLTVALFISWTTARLVDRSIAHPMERLRAGVRRIGLGDLGHRIGRPGQDEISQLGTAFDEMADRLAEREQQVNEQTAALLASEAHYRAIVEDQTELICRYRPDGTLTFVNGAYGRYFGRRPEELIGQKFVPLIVPDDTPLVEAYVGSLGRERPVGTIEHRVILADGSIRWQHWTDRVLFDPQGQIVEYQAVGRDITERRRAADELLQLNAALEDRVRERTGALTAEITERQQAQQRSLAFSALGQQLSAATTAEIAAEVITTTADQLLGWDVCFLELYYPDQDMMQTALFIETIAGRRTHLALDGGLRPPTATQRRVFRDGGQLMLADDPQTAWPEIEWSGEADEYPASLLFAPIRNGAAIIGYLSIQSYAHQAYDQAALATLQALADHCGSALERIQIEAQVRASLQDKEVLLKEIHHRVKNNLQVITSLLSLQSRQVTDPGALQTLRDSQNRVRSMALVHEKLYRSADLAHLDFADYIQGLAAQLLRTYADQAAGVALQVQADPLELDVEAAVACGLILNELVSNALKHAFSGGRAGTITIRLQPARDHTACLQVSDDGAGWPAGLDFRNSPSLGLQLVNTLVAQLNGTIDLQPGPGTTFQITFATAPTSAKNGRP